MGFTKTGSSFSSKLYVLENILTRYILSLGWFVLLTGIFWAGNRSIYHKLFYLFIAVPCVLTLLLHPKDILNNSSA